MKIRLRATTRKARGDQLKSETIISTSPAKLIVGGRAILRSIIISHQAPARGKIIIVPRSRIIVRLFVRS